MVACGACKSFHVSRAHVNNATSVVVVAQPNPYVSAMRRLFHITSALCLATATLTAATAEPRAIAHVVRKPLARPQLIGSWGAWHAATHQAAGAVVCYAFTRTASSTPHLRGRGDVVLTVTERPGAPRDAVALSAGFTYPPGSAVVVIAGDVRLPFYTAQRSAFARSGHEAVHAFEVAGGKRATAAAHSPAPHGDRVTDTFSLEGFDDAHAAITKACPIHA